MKQAEQAKQEETANVEKTLHDLGIVDTSGTSTQSSYDTTQTASNTRPANADGIEYDRDPQPATVTPADKKPTASNAKPTVSSPKPVTQPVATSQPAKTSTPAKTATPATPAKTAAPPKAPVSSGRYLVVTGAFKSIENARDEMEKLVKLGYTNAEVKSLAPNYYHAIATRSSDKASAEKVVEQLKWKGYPNAYVRDSKK